MHPSGSRSRKAIFSQLRNLSGQKTCLSYGCQRRVFVLVDRLKGVDGEAQLRPPSIGVGDEIMRVGMHLGFQNLHGVPDVQSFMEETKLAIEVEAMGFDYVGPVEHHFTDYAACPDPFQLLSYIAAKTSTIDLITAAVILPWNNPLRVVEQAIELDILSEGRLILGMGRGAARREFRSFGVEPPIRERCSMRQP